MNTFKITPEGIREIRSRTLKIMIPIFLIVAIAVPLIAQLTSNAEEVNVLGLTILISAMILFFPVIMIRSTKRTKQVMESLVITLDEDSITRTQDNTPDLTITKKEIKEILEGPKGDLIVKSHALMGFIVISRYTEKLDEIKILLENLAPIQQKPATKTPLVIMSGAMVATLGIFVLFLFAENKWLIISSGGVLILVLLTLMVMNLLNKTLERRLRLGSLFLVIVVVGIINRILQVIDSI